MTRRVLTLAVIGSMVAGAAPAAGAVVDARAGTVGPVGLNDRARHVVAALGPGRITPQGPIYPTAERAMTTTAPGSFRVPGKPSPNIEPRFLRYRRESVGLVRGRVFVVISTDRHTRLRGGPGMGDALAGARARFPGLACRTAGDAHGSETFRYCAGRVASHRYLYLGGDPISSVAIATVPLYP